MRDALGSLTRHQRAVLELRIDDLMERDEMERELRDLRRGAFGEPLHQVAVAAVRPEVSTIMRKAAVYRPLAVVAAALLAAAAVPPALAAGHGPRAGHGVAGPVTAPPVIAYIANASLNAKPQGRGW